MFTYWQFCCDLSHYLFSCIITGRNEVVAKVMFLQVCVCPRGGGCLPQCMLGCHTPSGPGRPPRMENPPREADSSIRSTSGRYASYWNAFLFKFASTRLNLKDRRSSSLPPFMFMAFECDFYMCCANHVTVFGRTRDCLNDSYSIYSKLTAVLILYLQSAMFSRQLLRQFIQKKLFCKKKISQEKCFHITLKPVGNALDDT